METLTRANGNHPWAALQFGHAGEGVETWYTSDSEVEPTAMLQFGHAGEGVETCEVWHYAPGRPLLQFGHAGEGVETFVSAEADGMPVLASIRPRR